MPARWPTCWGRRCTSAWPARMPLLTITRSFGLEGEQSIRFREAMGESIDPSRSPAQRQAAAQEIIDMIVAVIAARRDESRDDVISMLVAAEIDTDAGRQRLS